MQKLEWRADYSARKMAERRERPNALPQTAMQRITSLANPLPKAVAPEAPRFQPGTVLAFALGAHACRAVCGTVSMLTPRIMHRRGRCCGRQV